MYNEYEQASDIIGCCCTLLTPCNGYSGGVVVGDYGNEIVVRLSNGNEIVEYRDEVLIYDD
ncbi:MAG: ribonuclease P [Porphyromonadaceae bacterium]|nr:ribonuclease P [Porphyromonadaceae bacterium]